MEIVSALKRAVGLLRQRKVKVKERHERGKALEQESATTSTQRARLWAQATPAQREILWAQATRAERAALWAQMAPVTRTELRKLMHTDGLSVQAALNRLCEELWGPEAGAAKRRQFFVKVVPIARAVIFEGAQPKERFHDTEHTVREIVRWMRWLDRFDPLAARMIDLRYVAGLSIKEVGRALQLHPACVLRELRRYRDIARLNIEATQPTPPESGLPDNLISEISLA